MRTRTWPTGRRRRVRPLFPPPGRRGSTGRPVAAAREALGQAVPVRQHVGHLVLHLTGNLNHYIGRQDRRHRLRPRSSQRVHRPGRLPAPRRSSASFHEAVEMVVRTIRSLDATASRRRSPTSTDPDPFGLFLVCAAHLNNHIGQMTTSCSAGHSTQNRRSVSTSAESRPRSRSIGPVAPESTHHTRSETPDSSDLA